MYEANNDCEIITHPDSVVGLSPKRQWIVDNIGDCFQVDDDLVSVKSMVTGRNIPSDEIHSHIEDLYFMALDANIKLFGFNRIANPVVYSGLEPYKCTGFVSGGGIGLIKDENLWFPEDMNVIEDYWYSALNAHYNRKCLINQMISFSFRDSKGQSGGCADYRTVQKEKDGYITLRKAFGEAIVPKGNGNPRVKQKNDQWEKSLRVPF
jgi:hypothetical protein